MTAPKDPPVQRYFFEFGDQENHLPLRLRKGADFKSFTIFYDRNDDGKPEGLSKFTRNANGTYTLNNMDGDTMQRARMPLGEDRVNELLQDKTMSKEAVLRVIYRHMVWNKERGDETVVWINGNPKLDIPNGEKFFKNVLENNGIDIETGGMKKPEVPSSPKLPKP